MEKYVRQSRIEHHPNPLCVSINTRQLLLAKKTGWLCSGHMEGIVDGKSTYTEMPTMSQVIFDRLLQIDGVKEVSFRPYQISLLKVEAYTWDEILVNVKDILIRYLP